MGKLSECLTPKLTQFIEAQKMFFVGTAMQQGNVNISPKGMDSFRVIHENKVLWLNVTGSGNETATHVQHSPRMTIMFMAVEGKPLILRLYGKAEAIHPKDPKWDSHIALFPDTPGSRQIFEMTIEKVQESCGMAVPLYHYKEDRTMLSKWAESKGEEGIKAYWEEKNTRSLDGHETGIF